MSRYLIVANQTIGGSELMDEIRRRVASGHSSFYVVVPFAAVGIRPGLASMGDTGLTSAAYSRQLDRASEGAAIRAERMAEERLKQLLGQIRALGCEAHGEVGVSDPVKAIDSVVAHEDFDEIIISTLPEGVSRWLRMDVPNRVKRKFHLPVTTVTAKK